jgi:hypothetical protein
LGRIACRDARRAGPARENTRKRSSRADRDGHLADPGGAARGDARALSARALASIRADQPRQRSRRRADRIRRGPRCPLPSGKGQRRPEPRRRFSGRRPRARAPGARLHAAARERGRPVGRQSPVCHRRQPDRDQRGRRPPTAVAPERDRGSRRRDRGHAGRRGGGFATRGRGTERVACGLRSRPRAASRRIAGRRGRRPAALRSCAGARNEPRAGQ